MTKKEMIDKICETNPKEYMSSNLFDEMDKTLNWKEVHKVYVILNWFKVHDKHRFLQYRSLFIYAGDYQGVYKIIFERYRKEMKMRGVRI